MFNSLIYVKFNWSIYGCIAVLIYLFFPDLSTLSYIAILVSLHQFTLLLNAIGYVIPVRYLFGVFMCLQMLIGPMLAYNGLDQFQLSFYKMRIPEETYFLYVLPAVIFFILGLHFFAGNLKGEIVNEKAVNKFVSENTTLPYIFIAIGFISSVISDSFPANLAFIFYLIGGLKFIGAFLIIIGKKGLKITPLILVYGSIIISSLGQGMFHDLLTWGLFLGAVFAIKYKPGIKIKLLTTIGLLLFTLIIQQLKGNYREATWQRGKEANLATMNNSYTQTKAQNNLFSFKSLAVSNVRINQGYIITNIMRTVPAKEPYARGEELEQILEAAFLPRFLAPDKLNAGDQTLFKKYTGMALAKGTSMGLSSVGDAYVNFGVTGGCIFMFLFGVFFNEVLKIFYRQSKLYPMLLLFMPLVFYYPIRPDCELQTQLGHLIKSCFLIFVIFLVWKKYFKVYPSSSEKDIHTHTLVSSGL